MYTKQAIEKTRNDANAQQEDELRENVRRARKACDAARMNVKTVHDPLYGMDGERPKPTKKQQEDIDAAALHLKQCIDSLDAFLRCIR